MHMKKIKHFSLMVASIFLASHPLSAQRQVTIQSDAPNSIVMVSIDDADDELIRIINDTQLPHVHDPQAPRFVLTDRQGNFALGIGGYVRTVASYDMDGIVDNIDFIPALIPNSSPLNNQFQLGASTANLFVKLVGNNDLLGDFIVHTEGNFRGSDNTFKLRQAYISFSGLTIGYTYGGFMDASAMPATIDFQGPNGATFYRATQLAYTYKGLQNFQFNASVEMPSVNASANGFDTERQRMPNFTAYAQYNWDNNSHLRIGGILRNMTYTSTFGDNPSDATGYGVQASTNWGIGPCRLFGQFTYGKGIAHYFNDLGELNVDLVPRPDHAGRMQTLPMMGWYAGLQYNITPALFLSGTYSHSRLYSEDGYSSTVPDSYRYGQYVAANLFWNVADNMQIGAEYLHGWRTNFNDSDHQANRINLLAKYSF